MADRGRIAAEMNEAAKQEGRKITEKCKEKGYMQRSKGDLTDQSLSPLPPIPVSLLQNSIWFIRTD